MTDEWFVIGIDTELDDDGATEIRVPKYVDATGGIDSWVGRINDFAESKWSDLPWYGREMFVIRVYASQTALDDLASRDDAWGKVHEGIADSDAAAYLNDRHPVDRTWAEWQDHYLVT